MGLFCDCVLVLVSLSKLMVYQNQVATPFTKLFRTDMMNVELLREIMDPELS